MLMIILVYQGCSPGQFDIQISVLQGSYRLEYLIGDSILSGFVEFIECRCQFN